MTEQTRTRSLGVVVTLPLLRAVVYALRHYH
jgi:hypothetical protein